MKTKTCYILSALALTHSVAISKEPEYRTFIRQIQLASGVSTDTPDLDLKTNQALPGIAATGNQNSRLPIELGGARFEIYSVLKAAPYTSYLLDKAYVGVKVTSSIVVDTEDPYGKTNSGLTYANPAFVASTGSPLPDVDASKVRRTRVDRPFKVYVTTGGLSSVATDPDALKKVDFRRQVLSYAGNYTGMGVSLTPAIYGPTPLSSLATISTRCDEYTTQIPSASVGSTCGEEIFSTWTLANTQFPGRIIPPNMLDSQRVQICPMTSGTISGIVEGQRVRLLMPKITCNYTGTYPNSETYAQIYKGAKRSGAQGDKIPGTARLNTGNNPENFLTTSGDDLNSLITSDGTWTIELLTYVPCFKDTLCFAFVSFEVDRSIKANGNFTTIE